MSTTELYYFSGTGNSLHVARELQKRLPGAVIIPLAGLLGRDAIASRAETVGFVFPVHLASLPIPVKQFIRKLDLSSARYVFAAATRTGTQHGAFFAIDKLLKKKGRELDASFTLNMPSNDPKFNYKPLTAEATAKLEAVVQDRLGIMAKTIAGKEHFREKDTSYTTRVPFVRLLSVLVTLTEGMQQKFYADEKCNGCGICETVCLSRKIKMESGKPLWQKQVQCYKCSACLDYCPRQAVQIKSYTEKNGRYSHPYATAEEIAAQKR